MEDRPPADNVTTMPPLAEGRSPQVNIDLTRLSAGGLYLPMNLFVAGAHPDTKPLCPSMSWLISHGPSKTNVL